MDYITYGATTCSGPLWFLHGSRGRLLHVNSIKIKLFETFRCNRSITVTCTQRLRRAGINKSREMQEQQFSAVALSPV